jgi:hypothetical protein
MDRECGLIYSNSWDHSYDPDVLFSRWFEWTQVGSSAVISKRAEKRHFPPEERQTWRVVELPIGESTELDRLNAFPLRVTSVFEIHLRVGRDERADA